MWDVHGTCCSMIAGLNALHAGVPSRSRTQVSGLPKRERSGAQIACLSRLMSRAAQFCKERRGLNLPSGAHAVAKLCKFPVDDYGREKLGAGGGHAQIPLQADLLVEPSPHAPSVDLLKALPDELAFMYSDASHASDKEGKSLTVQRELEEQFAFIGGRKFL